MGWHEDYNKACDELKAAEAVYHDAERKMADVLDRLDRARREVTRLYQERARQINA